MKRRESLKPSYVAPFSIELLRGSENKILFGVRYSLGKYIDSADIYLGAILFDLLAIRAGYSPFIKTKETIGDTPKGTELTGWFVSAGLRF